MILYGGDNLIHFMLFWALFLPLDSSFSFDRALSKSQLPPKLIFNAGTAAFIIQICLVYWSSVAYKWNSDWLGGKAVQIALSIEQFATDAGLWLKQQTALLPALTYLTLYTELLGPFLALMPIYTGPLRTAAVGIFIVLHFSFGFFLALGLFPYICATAWFFFLPAWFWDHLLPRLHLSPKNDFKLYYNDQNSLCDKWVRLAQTFLFIPSTICFPLVDQEKLWFVVDAQGHKLSGTHALIYLWKRSVLFWPLWWLFHFSWTFLLLKCLYEKMASKRGLDRIKWKNTDWHSYPIENSVVTFLCIYNIFVTIDLEHPKWESEYPNLQEYGLSLGRMFHLNQRWNMFSSPLREDGWYVIDGTLIDGSHVDLFREGQPVSWEKPASISTMYNNDRWRKYMMNLWMKAQYKHRGYLSDYLCHHWNENHPPWQQVTKIKIYYMLKLTKEDLTEAEPQRVLIWAQKCSLDKGASN